MLCEHGWTATRNLEQSRDGGGDILGGPLNLEVKLTEKLSLRAAWKQACEGASDGRPVCVAHRCNGERWLATVDLRWLLNMIAEAEALEDELPELAIAVTGGLR